MARLFKWIAGGSLSASLYREIKDQLAELDENEEASSVDELQLDPLIDHFTDKLFGWLTVLVHEPKYYFLAPAVAEAVTLKLRKRSAGKWNSRTLHREIEAEIRYLEACLCEALCLSKDKGAVIIGINRWKRQRKATKSKRVTRHSIKRFNGIQEQLGMHPTLRYLARSQTLFDRESKRRSTLDVIEEQIRSPLAPSFWWHKINGVDDVVSRYVRTFSAWLEREGVKRKMSILLSEEEHGLLKTALYGNRNRTFQQEFLFTTRDQLQFSGGQAASSIFSALARSYTRKSRLLKEVSVLAKTIGAVRYCYNGHLADKFYNNPDGAKALALLKKVKLPKSLSDSPGPLANSGLEFLHRCVKIAQSTDPNQLLTVIYERERKIKGNRRRLYKSKNKILVRPDSIIKDKKKIKNIQLAKSEPPMRISNVRHVLWRLRQRRKAA
jgi:hypothetical protein